MANVEVEVEPRFVGPVDLRWPSRSRGGPVGHFEIPGVGQLVEMMASHVWMKPNGFRRLADGDPIGMFVGQEVDATASRITECRGDCIDQIGELGRGEAPVEGARSHVGSLPRVTLTQDSVIEALRPVQDPELHRSIVDLDMVRRVDLAPPEVTVAIDLTIAGCPLRAEIDNRIKGAVLALDGVESVVVEFGVMSDEQRANLRQKLHGDPGATAGTNEAHGHAEGRTIPFADPDSKTRVLLIASGKGGVGKSSVTTNLAVALGKAGKSVAVVDADVWGFSIPRMLGVDREPTIIDEMIVPPEASGVRCISMGFFVEEDQPVIWRGPMLHKALEQFLTDVFWDDPDYLLVDLPPGTGDIALSISQFLPRGELIVVTTPQQAAQKVAQRAAYMAHKVNISITGVIENMSWFTGDDGKQYELFGAGGGQELADDLEVPLLAKVPLVPAMRQGGDDGNPIANDADSEAGSIFAAIAEKIDVELAPKRRYRSELRVI